MQTETASAPVEPLPADMEPTPTQRSRRHAVHLALIAMAGLAFRVVAVYAGGAKDTSNDGIFYHLAGKVLADGGGYVNPWNGAPTASHPPAWPVALGLPSLAGLDTLLAHQLFACVVGATTVVLIGIAARTVAGERAGVIAAVIAAAYPNFWVRERELSAETLVLPMVAVVLILAYRYWMTPRRTTFAALCVACGVLTLVRAEQVLLLVLLLPPLALRAGSAASLRRRLARLAAGVSIAVVVLLPWLVRNATRFDEPALLGTSQGVVLRAANCPAAYYGDRVGYYDPDVWSLTPSPGPGGCAVAASGADESVADAKFRDKALDYMREHAGRLPIVVAAREGRTWGLFRPFQQATFDREWGGGPSSVYQAGLIFYWALLPFAVAGVRRVRDLGLPLFPLLSFVAVVAIAVAVTHGMSRYRAPADVSIVVLAAVGVDALAARFRSRRSSPATSR